MTKRTRYRDWRWQALWWHHFFLLWNTIDGQTRYTIPEELKQGSVVGHLAKDLGLGLSEIFDRKLRVASEAGKQYFSVDTGKGELVVNERIDREDLCGQRASCVLPLQAVLESPLQLHRIEVDVIDVNDNAPEIVLNSPPSPVRENVPNGTVVALISARDLDSGDNGDNSKLSYSILDSKVQDVSVSSYVYINSENGSIYSMHSFDYEKLKVFQIQVQAKDHGSPSLSSNATVHVFILDQNDNAPSVIYPSSAVHGSLSQQRTSRSSKAGHLVTKVTAVDADSGHNAWISYRLAEATDASLFAVNLYTGEVRTKRAVSEQDDSSQRLLIEIKDDGDPVQSTTVTVSVLLEDGLHKPILDLRHKTDDSHKKTGRMALYLILSLASVSVLSLVTFLILAVKCLKSSRSSGSCCMRRSDSEDYKNPNRNLQLQLNTDGPIKYVEVLGGDMMSQSQSFRSCLSPTSEYSDFTFVKPSSTTDFKDMINVLDASLPDSTWTFESQQVDVLDVNDNSPEVILTSEPNDVPEDAPSGTVVALLSARDLDSGDNGENGRAGTIIYSVSASDLDLGDNAKLSYSILDSKVQDVSVSSYVYINSENGSILQHALLDYEKLKNDNAPSVIYPSSAVHGFLSQQRTSRSSKAGHLVTKVTAVDADSGHNAWISYRLAEATDASLFAVNLYTGEVRTKRAVSEQDDSSQRLLIEIKDDGDPVQSTTVTVSVLLEDGLHEPILDLGHKTDDSHKKTGRMALYLILSLASVSCALSGDFPHSSC
ncbi:unnamed protein product [Boreogadus saida]